MKIEKKQELVRICAKIRKEQREKLDRISKKTKKTLSLIIREVVDKLKE